MIGVRKSLDFVFTQHELKILDDVMPDQHKKERHEENKESDPPAGGPGLLPNASSGNVAIPLANGNILKIPVEKFSATHDQASVNISEQLAKSGAWKNIDQKAHQNTKPDKTNGSGLVLNCLFFFSFFSLKSFIYALLKDTSIQMSISMLSCLNPFQIVLQHA